MKLNNAFHWQGKTIDKAIYAQRAHCLEVLSVDGID